MYDRNQVVDVLKMPLCVCDATLSMGEQTAGAVFSDVERYRIAKLLDEARVPQIEAGIPALGESEKKAVKHIAHMGLNASVMASNRAEVSEIDASIECDVDSVSVALPVSDVQIKDVLGKDRDWVLDKIYESVGYAAEHGFYIEVIAEDAARADVGFLLEAAKVSRDAGANRFTFGDTVGVADPFRCIECIKTIGLMGIDIGIDAANDFGLATANALAAVKGGAKFVRTTSMGIGRRAGCIPLEEAVMTAQHILDKATKVNASKLLAVAEAVSKASGVGIWAHKPIIGSGCFALETGIADNHTATEPYDPSEVGQSRTIVVGKHSNRNTIAAAMAEMNIEIEKNDAETLVPMVRKASAQMHRSLTPDELFILYEDMMSGGGLFGSLENR